MVTRAHIIVPEHLLEAVDRIAGKRKRSRFVEAAIREKLSREALSSALGETVGVLNPADYTEWETPEKTSAWVHASRRGDDAGVARKLGARDL